MSATLFATPVHRHAYLRQVLRAIDALPVEDVPQAVRRKGFSEYLYAFKNMSRTVITGVCGLSAVPGQPICRPGSFDLNKRRTKLTGACIYAPTYLRKHSLFWRDVKQEYFNVLYPFSARPPKISSKETGDVYTEYLSIPFLILHVVGAESVVDGARGEKEEGKESEGKEARVGADAESAAPAGASLELQGSPASPDLPVSSAAPDAACLGSPAQLLQLCALLYRPLQQAFLKRLPLFIHEQAVSGAAKRLLRHKLFTKIVPFARVTNGETHRGFLLLPEKVRPALEAVQAMLEANEGKRLEGVSPASLLSSQGGDSPSLFVGGPGTGLDCNFSALLPVAIRRPGAPPRYLQILQVDTEEELGQLADLVAACSADDRFLCSIQPDVARRKRLVREMFISACRADAGNGTVLAVVEPPPRAQAWSCGLNTVESFRTYEASQEAGAKDPKNPPNSDAARTANFIQTPAARAVAYVAYCPPTGTRTWGGALRVFSSLQRSGLPLSFQRQLDHFERERADVFMEVPRMFDVRFLGALAPALDEGLALQLLAQLETFADLGKAHLSMVVTQQAQEGALEPAGFRRKAIVRIDNQASGVISKAYLLAREPQSPTALRREHSVLSGCRDPARNAVSPYKYTIQPPSGSGPLNSVEEGPGASGPLASPAASQQLDPLADQSAVSKAAARGVAVEPDPVIRLLVKGRRG